MAIDTERLEYLREPRFVNFGAEIFTSSLRLPVFGAILELTPVPEEDVFYPRQVITILDTDPGNTMREIQRAERIAMVGKLPVDINERRKVFYERLVSTRWNVIEAAINSAKGELGL